LKLHPALRSLAKNHPRHLLASHSLFWAGEANARAREWSLAQENWEELEKAYPRSAYLPDALAGLARAHESQGNSSRAQSYRETLIRAFPKSPVAMSLLMSEEQPTVARPRGRQTDNIPVYSDQLDELDEMGAE
jgi:TolA-binding protein